MIERMAVNERDNWDQHWTEFSSASDAGPTPKYRSRMILNLLGIQSKQGVRMLELGSGTGEFAQMFRKRYPDSQYLGLELSAAGVNMAKKAVPTAQFVQRNLLEQDAGSEGMDFGATHAVCSEVLEHIDEPARLLRNALPYMAPGCRLVVTVPGGPINEFYRVIGHRKHYTSAEMSALLESCGFKVEKAMDAGFPFYNLFRFLLQIRGKDLLADVKKEPGALTRFVLRVFGWLFYADLRRFGWQVFVVARRK